VPTICRHLHVTCLDAQHSSGYSRKMPYNMGCVIMSIMSRASSAPQAETAMGCVTYIMYVSFINCLWHVPELQAET